MSPNSLPQSFSLAFLFCEYLNNQEVEDHKESEKAQGKGGDRSEGEEKTAKCRQKMLQRREAETGHGPGRGTWRRAAWTKREAYSVTTSCHWSPEFLSARLDSGCEAHSNGRCGGRRGCSSQLGRGQEAPQAPPLPSWGAPGRIHQPGKSHPRLQGNERPEVGVLREEMVLKNIRGLRI